MKHILSNIMELGENPDYGRWTIKAQRAARRRYQLTLTTGVEKSQKVVVTHGIIGVIRNGIRTVTLRDGVEECEGSSKEAKRQWRVLDW